MSNTDLAIIGAGPVGIELATELKRLGLEYRHFEAGQIGSTIEWFAPGTTFFSSPERISIARFPFEVPNQTKATREQYLAYLRQVVSHFDLKIETFREVCGLKTLPDGFQLDVRLSRHGYGSPRRLPALSPSIEIERIKARKVVLAIGDMHEPRMLGVPGENLPHVSHYLEDPHYYFRKDVLIVGGRNSAVEAAIRLYRGGARVTLAHRHAELNRDEIKYWLYPEMLELIRRGQIKFLPATLLNAIFPGRCELSGPQGNAQVKADFVLLLTGYLQDQKLFSSAGVSITGESHAPDYNRDTMETNVPGLYLAGTAAAGKFKTRRYREFIETSHVHVERIIRALGHVPQDLSSCMIPYELSES